jgi:hypothetical protein
VYLQQYAEPALKQELQAAHDGKYRIRYETYDWSLNDADDDNSHGDTSE